MFRDGKLTISAFIILLLSFLTLTAFWTAPLAKISFGISTTVNRFPSSLTFQTKVRSDAGEITKAWFFYIIKNELDVQLTNRVTLDISPDTDVELAYTWDTEDRDVVPGTPIVFWWEAQDVWGNRARSEEHFLRYEDVRYDWQVLEDESLSVWWHDISSIMGSEIFEIASEAVTVQADMFQTYLRYPIRIMIYNNFMEFAGYHVIVADTIGGEAYPGFGITAQIVPEGSNLEFWLNEVLPHEISHLYFAQITYHSLRSGPPSWLNEGVAMTNEFVDLRYRINNAKVAAARGDLIPLTGLSGSFGPYDEEKFRLAYDESYSAVQYLLEMHGWDALARLLANYREGMETDEAFKEALDMDLGEFQSNWAKWLGASKEFLPTPTELVWSTYGPQPTATFKAVEPLKETAVMETIVVVVTSPTPLPREPTPDSGSTGGCYLGSVPIGLFLLTAWLARDSRSAKVKMSEGSPSGQSVHLDIRRE